MDVCVCPLHSSTCVIDVCMCYDYVLFVHILSLCLYNILCCMCMSMFLCVDGSMSFVTASVLIIVSRCCDPMFVYSMYVCVCMCMLVCVCMCESMTFQYLVDSSAGRARHS